MRRALTVLGILGAALVAEASGPAPFRPDGPGMGASGAAARPRDLPALRAEWNAALRQDPQGRVLARHRLDALEKACLLPVDPAMRPAGRDPLVPGTRWEPLGPRPQVASQLWGATSGRIAALALHPTNPDLVLVGSATGGIWKSTDGGRTFRPVSDDSPALAVSGFAFSPSSPDVVYAATGEQDSAYIEQRPSRSLGLYLGAGLLRSVDAGDSWQRIDRNLPENGILSRVLVHPRDPRLVLAGLYIVPDPALPADSQLYQYRPGGLWRSTDAGVTFVPVFEHAVSDLVQDPGDPYSVYVAFGVSKGSAGCAGCGCPTCLRPSGVYRSRDFGLTFEPLLVGGGPGSWAASQSGPVRVAVSPASPAVLYASVVDDLYRHAGGGLFRSDDAGATWRRLTTPEEGCGPQCHYDHALAVSPADPERVFFGGVDLYTSTDGGGSWRRVSTYATALHPDIHAFAVHPARPDTLWIASDGGLYSTANLGATFGNHNDTLTLAQLTGMAVHPTDPDFLLGGTQDNGNLRFRGSWTWSDRTGGDGGICLIRRNDPTKVLASHYYAYLVYSASSGDAFNAATPPLLMDSSGNPTEPMSFYPPIVAAPGAPGTVFLGTNRVWSNATFGQTAASWRARSEAPITGSLLTALEVAGDGSGVIWAGDRVGGVFLSTDGGARWERRAAGLPAGIVTRLRTITSNGLSAYATFGSYFGAPSRHVFRTTDGGLTWQNLSSNLPDVPVLSLTVDPQDPNDLFVGTDAGVFRSRDGGAAWAAFSDGLPLAGVTDLAFGPRGDLVAATYGRGVFRIASSSSLPLAPQADFSWSPPVPEPGASVSFSDRSAGLGASFAWDFGDGSRSPVRNPSKSFAEAGRYAVTLTVSGAGGATARTREVTVAAAPRLPGAVVQVPVVLEALGVGGVRFTSDLVLASRAAASTRVSLDFLPAPGVGGQGPKVTLELGPGRQRRIPDVVAYLRDNGWSLPSDGGTVGTLLVTFEDVPDASLVFAGSRASSPNPNRSVGGAFGLFLPGVSPKEAPSSSVWILGLREDESFRSNLAFVDVPGGSGPAVLSVELFDGDSGERRGSPLSVALQAGEWRQIGSVLDSQGIRNGLVRVTRSGGGDNRFLVYGVVNDGAAAATTAAAAGGGTSDGTYVAPEAGSGLLPVVLSAGGGGVVYRSELVLTNTASEGGEARLRYTPAAQLGGAGGPHEARISLPPGRQLRVPDALAYLRDVLRMPLPAGDVAQGGTLEVAGASALVRVWNPNPDTSVGGTFGLSYPAVPPARRARGEAWIHGLRQDQEARSNVAIADARVGDPATVTYTVELFDGESGGGTPVATHSLALAGGQWGQLTGPLAAAGLSSGYARVRPSATSDFVAYAVVNDGAGPGDPTSDGSYLPMSAVK